MMRWIILCLMSGSCGHTFPPPQNTCTPACQQAAKACSNTEMHACVLDCTRIEKHRHGFAACISQASSCDDVTACDP